MRAWIEEPPKPLEQRHIVVTGFIGSDHDKIGRELATALGRGVRDTFEDAKTRAIWEIDPDLASFLEISAAVPLCDLPPRVALMRTAAFCRRRAHQLFSVLNPIKIFVDTPPAVCRQNIEAGNWSYGDNGQLQAAALRDLSTYDRDSTIAIAYSNILVTNYNTPETTSAQLATRLILERLTGGPPSVS